MNPDAVAKAVRRNAEKNVKRQRAAYKQGRGFGNGPGPRGGGGGKSG